MDSPDRDSGSEQITPLREAKQFLPCKICGRKSTGVHYGVVSCEGCKAFFKRGIVIGSKYQCFFGGNCDTTIRSRRCRACRFQKCVREGMSLDAVKMGRIPTFRSNKAYEVKKMPKSCSVTPTISRQSSIDLSSAANVSNEPRQETFGHFGVVASSHHDRPTDNGLGHVGTLNRAPSRAFADSNYSHDHPGFMDLRRRASDITAFHAPNIDLERRVLMSRINSVDLSKLSGIKLEPVEDPPLSHAPSGTSLFSKTALALLPTVKAMNLNFEATVDGLHRAIQICYADQLKTWDEFVVHTQRYGPPEQPQTTIEMFIASLAFTINDGVERGIKFISLLPGIDQFDPIIQRTLGFERWVEIMLSHHSNYCRDGEMYFLLSPHNLHCCRFWVDKIVNPDYVKFVLQFAKKMNDLNLSLTETYTFMCVAMFRQDVVEETELSLRRQILYAHYSEVLFRLITERVPANAEQIIAKLHELLASLITAQFLNKKYFPLEDVKNVSHNHVGGSGILSAFLAGAEDQHDHHTA